MADERFAEDTVFVIFEGDYTLLKSDETARLEWEAAQDQIGLKLRATYELAAVLPEQKSKEFKNRYLRWNEMDPFDRQMHTSEPWPEWRKCDGVAKPKVFPKPSLRRPGAAVATGNEVIEVEGPPQKDAMYVACDHSQFLLDVVDIANTAARHGCGHFVWLGWDASHWTGGPEEKQTWKNRKESPTSGAHLSLMTTKGARFLMDKIVADQLPKGHMGHQFIFWLMHFQGNARKPNPEFGASYIVPPLGGYMTHNTTWMRQGRQANLKSHWSAKWMQEGTRTEDFKGRTKVRRLVHYREKGHCEEICQVSLPLLEEEWWYTEAPEDLPEDFRGVQDWHRPRVIEDSMKINGCLSSVARDEPVAIHFSCCTHQFEFEVDRSLIVEPSPNHRNIMRTILQTGRRSTSHMKPRKNSKTLGNI